MIRRIKYWLLEWLIHDICGRSRCKQCCLVKNVEYSDGGKEVCGQTYLYNQARKVWGL